MLSAGSFPEATLKLARDRRDEGRELLERGIDPSADRAEIKPTESNKFEETAREWLGKQKLAQYTSEFVAAPFVDSRTRPTVLRCPHLQRLPHSLCDRVRTPTIVAMGGAAARLREFVGCPVFGPPFSDTSVWPYGRVQFDLIRHTRGCDGPVNGSSVNSES